MEHTRATGRQQEVELQLLEALGKPVKACQCVPKQLPTRWRWTRRPGCEPLRRGVGFQTGAVRRSAFARVARHSAENILPKTRYALMNSPHLLFEIESWIGATLPHSYREFLNACDSELMVGEQVLLYGRSLLIERNQTYKTKDYCPGFITIGNDSGDMEFIMSLTTESLHMVDGGSMRLSQADDLATTFAPWFAAGCPIPQFEHDPIDWPADPLDRVLVYLSRKPEDLKVLLVLKHALGINISIGDLKRGLDNLPFLLLQNSSYAAARLGCATICDLEPCVEICLASDPTVQLPIQMANEA